MFKASVLYSFHADTLKLSGEDYNQSAWWQVDLGASYDVYEVIITNRNYFQGNIFVSARSICMYIGSGDPVRVLCLLHTTNTLDTF